MSSILNFLMAEDTVMIKGFPIGSPEIVQFPVVVRVDIGVQQSHRSGSGIQWEEGTQLYHKGCLKWFNVSYMAHG